MLNINLISSNFFFFNDTATTEIYTLSLHDALPIWAMRRAGAALDPGPIGPPKVGVAYPFRLLKFAPRVSRGASFRLEDDLCLRRSEEHTSELQSRQYLVCRLLLEKKKIPSSMHIF